MHDNENSDREDLVNEEGSLKVSVYFPKSKKGEYSIRKVKTDPTYGKHETLNHIFYFFFVLFIYFWHFLIINKHWKVTNIRFAQ